jgi:hypothetical protein
MKQIMLRALLVLGIGMIPVGTASAGSGDSVNVGVGAASYILPHCRATVLVAEYEHMLGPKLAVVAGAGGANYHYDDGSYKEDGRPKGVDLGVRYYFGGNGMQGVFLGGELGYWKTDWTFTTHKGTASQSQGDGENRSLRADVNIGMRIPIGASAVSLIPVVHGGRYFGSTSCRYTSPASRVGTSCSQTSEVTYFGFVALMAGVEF